MTPDELRKAASRTSGHPIREQCLAAADAWEKQLAEWSEETILYRGVIADLRKRLEAATPPPVVIRILTADTTKLSEEIDNATSLDEKEELVNWLDVIAALAGEEEP